MKTITTTTNRTYTVDFAARKIVVSAAFAKSASEYNSEAYNIMMGLRRDLPEFKIETLAEKKKSKEPILTLDIMEAYIVRMYGTDSAEVKEFHTVLETSKAKKNKRYYKTYEVKMRFTRDLVGAVMDQFGQDVWLRREDKGHFVATFTAQYNPQFVAWVLGFGSKVRILSPEFMYKDIWRYAHYTGEWHKVRDEEE